MLQPRPFDDIGRRKFGVLVAGGDVLQDRSVFAQQRAVIEAKQRDEPERIDSAVVVAFERALALGVDLNETGVGAGLVERDPARQRSGEK